jgi:hypothetical protein
VLRSTGTRSTTAPDDASGVAPDPLPDRNVFIRTDQFSFVREGIPSLAFKFGFAKDTPELQIEHEWRATRYHAPSEQRKAILVVIMLEYLPVSRR